MARIRSIKPDMRRSLTVCSWPYAVRWTFVGLPGYLDDFGRGIDDSRLVKAELYPLDDDMTPKRITQHLDLIAESGPLCRYEVEGRRYMHITSWSEHQKPNRPTTSRIPHCPVHEKDETHGALSEDSLRDSLSPHGSRSEGSEPSRAPAEQGTGNREQGTGNGVTARGARLPNDWTPSAELVEQMRGEGIPDELARRELPRFRDYWTAKSGRDATKLDWPATWRNWLRRAADQSRDGPSVNGNGRASTKAQGWLDVGKPSQPSIEGATA